MPKKFKVVWSNVAEDDLVGILEYIAADNPDQARKKLKEIKQKAGDLYAFPERGRIVPELLALGDLIYREFIVPPGELSIESPQIGFMSYPFWIPEGISKIFFSVV